MGRSLLHSAAAHDSWAATSDRTARTAPGRRAFLDKFAAEVDPEGVLPPDVREQMAEAKRRAYFKRMAARSVEARRAKRGVVDGT